MSTTTSLITMLLDWAAIFTLAALSWMVFEFLGVSIVSIFVYGVVVILIGSRQRALECLIHEAIHHNLSKVRLANSPVRWVCARLGRPLRLARQSSQLRRQLRQQLAEDPKNVDLSRLVQFDLNELAWIDINDLMIWSFAVLVLGHNLVTERISHFVHHALELFWTVIDPDHQRYHVTGIDRLPAHSYRELVEILVDAFPRYVGATIPYFFVPQREPRWFRLLRILFWFSLLAAFAAVGALLPLILYWIVPFFTALVVIRFFGEVGEHSALGCSQEEFGSTRNNLGFLNEHLIHPRGDGYHLVHHLYPSIPFHKLAAAHRILLNDPTYRDAGHHCYGLIAQPGSRLATIADLVDRGDRG